MSQNFIRPDYGNYLTQRAEHLELCGLDDPADRYDPPAGPAIVIPQPVTRYPIDRTTR